MHFLCLPGQTLAGRPAGLLTPRQTVLLPGWQGEGALRALSVQCARPQPGQKCLTQQGAGRLKAEPVPKENVALPVVGIVVGMCWFGASPSPTVYLGSDQVFSVDLCVYLHS